TSQKVLPSIVSATSTWSIPDGATSRSSTRRDRSCCSSVDATPHLASSRTRAPSPSTSTTGFTSATTSAIGSRCTTSSIRPLQIASSIRQPTTRPAKHPSQSPEALPPTRLPPLRSSPRQTIGTASNGLRFASGQMDRASRASDAPVSRGNLGCRRVAAWLVWPAAVVLGAAVPGRAELRGLRQASSARTAAHAPEERRGSACREGAGAAAAARRRGDLRDAAAKRRRPDHVAEGACGQDHRAETRDRRRRQGGGADRYGRRARTQGSAGIQSGLLSQSAYAVAWLRQLPHGAVRNGERQDGYHHGQDQ